VAQQLYARIDIQRFVRFYSGNARWALVDDLAKTSVFATSSARPILQPLPQSVVAEAEPQASSVPREAIHAAVLDAANRVLGSNALEGNYMPDSKK
jgi:hypothetical protein